MSDLLTRLAERALGLAPAVQPLLRSPYAAAPRPETEIASDAPSALPDRVVSASPPLADADADADAATTARRGGAPAPASPTPPPRPAQSPPRASTAADDGLLLPPPSVDPVPPMPFDLVPHAASTPSTARPLEEEAAAADAAPLHARARAAQPPRQAPRRPSDVAPAPGMAPVPVVGARPRRVGRAPALSPPRPFAGAGEADAEDGLLLPLRPAAEGAIAVRAGEAERQRPSGIARTVTAASLPSAAHDQREANEEAVEMDAVAPSATDRGLRSARAPAPARLAGDGGEGAPVERAPGAARGDEARPVVRVSIGRVEVRGPPPPEAPGRVRPAWTPPLLSLADYLKRGAGR